MIHDASIKEVKIIEPKVFCDERGSFNEVFSIRELQKNGIEFKPVQENCAFSLRKGTVRGIHFQNDPCAQAKLVRCTKGVVNDYAIDLRKGSPTYLQYVCIELSAENKKQLFIPKGFAHAVINLVDNSEIEYLVDNLYEPTCDRSVNPCDEAINIEWGFDELILSEKDRKAPFLKDSDCNFVYNNDVE